MATLRTPINHFFRTNILRFNQVYWSAKSEFRIKLHSTSSNINSKNITVKAQRGHDIALNSIWLRENCRCNSCYTHSTNQRKVLFNSFPGDIHPKSQLIQNEQLSVTWSDGHESKYDLEWINNIFSPKGSFSSMLPLYFVSYYMHILNFLFLENSKVLWKASDLKNITVPDVKYDDFMKNDNILGGMLATLKTYGFALVSDVPATEESTQACAERICFIQETFFGRHWTFTADLARGDTAYTNIALGAHTDATYLETPVGIQVKLFCKINQQCLT